MTAEVETLAQDEELLECSSLYPENVRNNLWISTFN